MKAISLLLPLVLLGAASSAPAQTAKDAELISKLEALAASGNAEAAYHLGMASLRGLDGVAKDPKRAFAHFTKAAEGGDPLGAYKLGCFYDGQGAGVVSDDAELALKHKLVAAKAGYSLAQNDVAKFFYAKDDIDQAVEWLVAAGKQGYQPALEALGTLYAGEGKLPKDMAKSYAYLLLSQGGSLDKAPDKARQFLTGVREKLTPAERSQADTLLATWRFKPTILTITALSGQQSARALVNGAGAAAKPAGVAAADAGTTQAGAPESTEGAAAAADKPAAEAAPEPTDKGTEAAEPPVEPE